MKKTLQQCAVVIYLFYQDYSFLKNLWSFSFVACDEIFYLSYRFPLIVARRTEI